MDKAYSKDKTITSSSKATPAPSISDSNTKPKNNSLLTYKIILVFLSLSAVILAITNVVIGLTPRARQSDIHHSKESALSSFQNMTKEDAMAALAIMDSESYWLPEGFIPDSFRLRDDEFVRELLYSYDSIDEVPQIAADSVMGLGELFGERRTVEDFQIDESTDYYTVVSVNPSKASCGELDDTETSVDCYRGISFNKKYLDHYRKTVNNSSNDIIEFKDLSPEFARLAMPIIVASDIMSSRSIYDYYFDDEENEYILGILCIGVGLDLDNMSNASYGNIPMAINLYEMKFALDKTTGMTSWVKHDNGERMDILKSIPITAEEAQKIYGEEEEQTSEGDPSADAAAASNAISSEELADMTYALCQGGYEVVYQSTEDTGLFQCSNPESASYKYIYSITDPKEEPSLYFKKSTALYLGTNDDEVVNEFFGGKKYIWKNYRNADITEQLVLLLESDSESSLVNDNIEAIYGFVKKINEKYDTDLNIYIFYTEDLTQTNIVKDYIVISGVTGYYGWLPNGNGFGEYYYDVENDPAALTEIASNPSLYSSQTRDAIKFHRHINATINNGRTISLEELRELLNSSFEEGL